MDRVNILRTQAKILRDLAGLSTNENAIRQRMLDLASACEELADKREHLVVRGILKSSSQ